MRTSRMIMDLADFLAEKLKTSTYRDMEAYIKVSRGALENIIRRQNSRLPEIETLHKIAIAYGKDLWEVLQMAGVDLGLPKTPTERAQRLAQLVARKPSLERVLERCYEKMDTDPGFVDGVIIGLEASLGLPPVPPDPAE